VLGTEAWMEGKAEWAYTLQQSSDGTKAEAQGLSSLFFFFSSRVNSGPHPCYEPCHQVSPPLWDRVSFYVQAGLLFVLLHIAGLTGVCHCIQPLVEMRVLWTFCPCWSRTMNLQSPLRSSHVARITGLSYCTQPLSSSYWDLKEQRTCLTSSYNPQCILSCYKHWPSDISCRPCT
jgi:hypothetical protein